MPLRAPRLAMPAVRIDSLRWPMGVLGILLGTMILVVPHQLAGPTYDALRSQFPVWGWLLLLGGVGILPATVLGRSARVSIVAHLVAGAVLLLFSWGFLRVGSSVGFTVYAILGIGTLLAPFLPSARERPPADSVHLFVLLVGLDALLFGPLLIFGPNTPSFRREIEPYLPWYGIPFSIGGALLLWVAVRPSLPRALVWAAHLFVAALYFSFIGLASIPTRAWTGIAVYGVLGISIALLPWLESRLRGFDPFSLRNRLALVLALAISLPLVIVVSLISSVVGGSEAQAEQAVNDARDLYFAILLGFMLLAVVLGAYLAHWLAGPLGVLARAADRLAEGLARPELPRSSTTEIARVSRAFEEMRERLANQSAERETLLEDAQRRATELQGLQQQRAKHVLGISHGLRTPLTVIQGQAQLLLRGLDRAGVNGRMHQGTQAIVASAQRMGLILRDLVDLTALESAQPLRLNVEPIELRSFLIRQKDQLSRMLDTDRIRVEAPEKPLHVLADPDRLERILVNLISNALKYSEGEVEGAISSRDGEVLISVRDHGPGISAEQLGVLFEPYRRTHERPETLGLGLYVTKGLVQAMGGRIWVESAPGKGSTFIFTLPTTP